MAQNRTCNLSVTGRPSSPLRHVFKVPTGIIIIIIMLPNQAIASTPTGSDCLASSLLAPILISQDDHLGVHLQTVCRAPVAF
jgi:hypothetical protein